MKTIPLTKGLEAIVDDLDYESASKHKWHAHESFNRDQFGNKSSIRWYVRRNLPGKKKKLYLHTFISGYAHCDHIDGNGLNNSRSNLRESSHSNNRKSYNRPKARWSSKWRGVSFLRSRGKFQASVSRPDSSVDRLGEFNSELRAAIIRDMNAIKYGYPKEGLNFNWRKIFSLNRMSQ